MTRREKGLLIAPLLLMALLTATPAQACQDLIFHPVAEHIEQALAVVHAKVKETKIVQFTEIGLACDAPFDRKRCRIVEVQLDILTVFKGVSDEIDRIYVPFVPDGVISCEPEPLPGEEYVLFLHTENGILLQHKPSFVVVGHWLSPSLLDTLGVPKKLEALRQWKAAQRH